MKLTRRPEWLILGILCIAANLRAPITGLPAGGWPLLRRSLQAVMFA